MKLILIAGLLFSAFAADANASQVLLYNGGGSSAGDVSALTSLLRTLGYSYTLANESQVNVMTQSQFAQYKLILWPGGNSITMGSKLTAQATRNIHNAIAMNGVSYLGFCAGAFMGETSTLYNTFKLATTYFNFYNEGAVETVNISYPDGSSGGVVYWDGPQLLGWGETLGKYPNGDPAVVQGSVGQGFVILSGVHPEATVYWDVPGYTSADASAGNAYAMRLISAAVNRASLAFF